MSVNSNYNNFPKVLVFHKVPTRTWYKTENNVKTFENITDILKLRNVRK